MFSLNLFCLGCRKILSLSLVFALMSANTQAKTSSQPSYDLLDQLLTQNTEVTQLGSIPSYSVTIIEYDYRGECPGKEKEFFKVWFVSRTTPPKKNRRVRITNVSQGLTNNPYPYTDRGYSEGESEEIDITIGKGHDDRYFILKRGENLLTYEIREKNTIIEEGEFKVYVKTKRQVLQRDKKPLGESEICVNYLRNYFSNESVGVPLGTEPQKYIWRI